MKAKKTPKDTQGIQAPPCLTCFEVIHTASLCDDRLMDDNQHWNYSNNAELNWMTNVEWIQH